MNGFLEPELAEFECSTECSIDNRCQTHVRLNGVTCLYIKNIYMYISDYMLRHVLEMSSFSSQTCLILKEMKHWGTLILNYLQFSYDFLSIMKVHCTELY